jgi:hypothetical protein
MGARLNRSNRVPLRLASLLKTLLLVLAPGVHRPGAAGAGDPARLR